MKMFQLAIESTCSWGSARVWLLYRRRVLRRGYKWGENRVRVAVQLRSNERMRLYLRKGLSLNGSVNGWSLVNRRRWWRWIRRRRRSVIQFLSLEGARGRRRCLIQRGLEWLEVIAQRFYFTFVDGNLVSQVRKELSLHLVDFFECELTSCHDMPWAVGELRSVWVMCPV